MKILQIVHHFPPESIAGCEQYVLDIVISQQEAGHEVKVLTRSIMNLPQENIVQWDAATRVDVKRVFWDRPYMDDWYQFHIDQAQADLERKLEEFAPDVVHVHHWISLTITIINICKQRNIPVVLTIHDLYCSCPTGHRMHVDGNLCEDKASLECCYRCLINSGDGVHQLTRDKNELGAMLSRREETLQRELELADVILFGDAEFRRFYQRFVALNSSKCHVLPLPVAKLPAQLPPASDDVIEIAYIGNVNKWKATHLLLEAVKRLPNRLVSKIRITILGLALHDEYQSKLHQLSAGLNVRFENSFYDLHELPSYRFHFCVLTSIHFESYSFVTSECIQMELPIIVSEKGAPSNRVHRCGLTFKHGDSKDLSKTIEQLVSNKALRTQLRNGCYLEKKKLLNTKEHSLKLLQQYRRIVQAGVAR